MLSSHSRAIINASSSQLTHKESSWLKRLLDLWSIFLGLGYLISFLLFVLNNLVSSHGASFPNVNTHTNCHNSCSDGTLPWLNYTAERSVADGNSLTSVKHIVMEERRNVGRGQITDENKRRLLKHYYLRVWPLGFKWFNKQFLVPAHTDMVPKFTPHEAH